MHERLVGFIGGVVVSALSLFFGLFVPFLLLFYTPFFYTPFIVFLVWYVISKAEFVKFLALGSLAALAALYVLPPPYLLLRPVLDFFFFVY